MKTTAQVDRPVMDRQATQSSAVADENVAIPPEMELLILCARHSLTGEQNTRIRNLAANGLDWEYLSEQAFRHCVAPLLHWRLSSICSDLLQKHTLEHLNHIFETSVRRNLLLTGQLVTILERCAAEGIPAIAYKGPVLASLFNENLALRIFGDLDILLHREDVQRAQLILLEAGFRPALYKSCPQEATALPFARAFHYEMSYTSEDCFTSIDLHWALMPGFFALPAVAEEIWDRAQPVIVAGRKVLTLAPEDLLLLVCIHGTKHIWERVGWIRDVASIIESGTHLDWDAIFSRAAQLRIQRALGLGLFLATDLLGVGLPDTARRFIESDPNTSRLAATVRKQLYENGSLYSGFFSSCEFFVRSRENIRDAVRCCVERALQPTLAEWTALPLPRSLFALYYLFRPLRLAGKHAWNIIGNKAAKT